jgi:rhamnulokinase
MGVETRTPKTDEATLRVNFTNEGGVAAGSPSSSGKSEGSIRLLKNIMGLWLVQECRRAWERAGKNYDYAELMKLAEDARPFTSIINPDDASFMLPQSMPVAIGEYCKKTNQSVPTDPGDVVRVALEGLAFRYRWVLERLEELVGHRLETIHIVGGGCQNTLLCQFAADACNRPVVAGPVEATAIGNVLVQAIGLGLLGSLADGRAVVRRSFDVQTYEPRAHERWQEPYRRFLAMIG